MRINIIGRANTWQQAPFTDISYGLTSILEFRDVDFVFDMHHIPDYLTGETHKRYKEARIPQRVKKGIMRAKKKGILIYSLEDYDGCTRYPIEEIVTEFNTDYFTCGACYAIAHAIYMGATQIHIYGIMLFSDEYRRQKAGIEFWLGMAEGRGVYVEVHGKTRLLEIEKQKTNDYKEPLVYGYEVPQTGFLDMVRNNKLIHHQEE